uniref:phosphoglycerate mutase n=1 Tax=Pseudoerythrocladia kornmannii TaxID=753682 RepID=UPI001BED465C|nr:phosphoglycerate mutase [Pseudoerythrocladia kornmannii]QUE28252.1 pgmA [Pseudoerythrocladia kornmannii]UNJ16756.1 phosphoglycerate mutase [Pseudoerythrocladia kornmannii]
MSTERVYPVVLTILDGWGYSQDTSGNAVINASTPILDSLLNHYPTTFLEASGESVGLPEGQVGNSEVGHTTIGAGRVIRQELVRISKSIQDKSFFQNKILIKTCLCLEKTQKSLHLVGLCSDGGVHSHIDHLLALIQLTQAYNLPAVYIHFIADGRDTGQYSATSFLDKIHNQINNLDNVHIATITGRYYAMDRDCRWNRTEESYNTLTQNIKIQNLTAKEVINTFYEKGISDEFLPPTRIKAGAIEEGDGLIFFNYRPDRMRQLLQSFAKPKFKGFQRDLIANIQIATFTQYVSSLPISIIFPPNQLNNFLGEIVSKKFLKQFRISETEKYAHVTYFFNGGVEEPFFGEDRELISSPKVATYDLTPEMSAEEITNSLIRALNKKCYSFIVVNYANPDMLGHTGNLQATIKAMEIVDQQIGLLLDAVSRVNGTLLLTADHGNAECMYDVLGKPHTSHTINQVPFICIEGEGNKITGHGAAVVLRQNGSLADIAPTILDLLELPQPVEMTGKSLISPVFYDVRRK